MRPSPNSILTDADLLKATGKTWEQWTEIIARNPECDACSLRKQFQLDFWWSMAIATALKPPSAENSRSAPPAQTSLSNLIKASRPTRVREFTEDGSSAAVYSLKPLP